MSETNLIEIEKETQENKEKAQKELDELIAKYKEFGEEFIRKFYKEILHSTDVTRSTNCLWAIGDLRQKLQMMRENS